jgi:maltose phosphorylase
MVTMNGEKNAITNGKLPMKKFTEMVHCFLLFNYYRYTGDYIPEKRPGSLIIIARFWRKRAAFSSDKKPIYDLGVTGPNE